MNWFNNLKISKKIISGYIVVALITMVTGYIGIDSVQQMENMNNELYTVNTKPIEEIGKASVDFQKSRVYMREALNSTDPQTTQQKLEMVDNLGSKMYSNLELFKKSIRKDSIKLEYDSLIKDLEEYDNIKSQFKNAILSGEKEQALAILDRQQSKDTLSNIESSVDKLYEMKIADANQKQKENADIADSSLTLIVIIGSSALLLSVLVGIVISKTISKPLTKFSCELNKLTKGDINIDINVDTKDEIGELSQSLNETINYIREKLYAINKIADGDLSIDVYIKSEEDILAKSIEKLYNAIKLIISEMRYMADEHNKGDIDIFIDESKFEGAYKEVASGINNMVGGHLRAKKQAINCVNEFAKGNFDAEIEKFPGKKAFINNAIEGMRKNLKEVNFEVNNLVKSANEGNLSDRAKVDLYNGDWAILMNGLNELIDGIMEPINEASQVLEEMSRGNLNVKVTGDYKGDHAKIKDSLNYTINTLHEYIEEISYTLKQMADHDLTMSIEAEYVGDFANIKSSLNLIINSLNQVMGDINFASEQVAAGSKQVSDSSQVLSQGSSEQASSVEEITASIEQVAEQTKQNALNANSANQLATKARDDAKEGNGQMNEMVKSMEAINESSSNISKIIKVIDDIAFQTNILALNAAVEAARAGQHGKGFAVVAEEVRNLAARSANAAKETTDMIENSIKTTEAGTNIAYQTAKSLEEILEGVSNVSNLVSEIASSSNEQATAVSQVNQAIDQVSTVTQMNTSTSEESAAASEELSGQAEMLKEMVGQFKLKDKYKSKSNQVRKNDYNYKNEKLQGNKDYDEIEISLDDVEFGKYS